MDGPAALSGLKPALRRAGRHRSSRSPRCTPILKSSEPVATIGLDIGKNTFHLVGLDRRGAIAMRIKVSRNQLVRRFDAP